MNGGTTPQPLHVSLDGQEIARTEAEIPGEILEGEAMGIAERIAAVKADLEAVPKTGYNPHFNYRYHSESDIANAIRPLTAKHGLAIVPTVIDYSQEAFTRKDSSGRRTIVQLEIAILGGAEERVVRWYGEAEDQADKGLSKAYTAAMKSFQSKLFEIGADESDDDGGRGVAQGPHPRDRGRRPGRQRATTGAPQGPPPPDQDPAAMTGGQRDYLRRLLNQRELPPDEKARIVERVKAGMTKSEAHRLIDELRTKPMAEKTEETQPPPPAIDTDGDGEDEIDRLFGPPASPEEGPPV